MPYVTLLQLSQSPGALELAQVATDSHARAIDATLMQLTLEGGDRDSYHEEEVAAADDAKTRIEALVAESDAVIDGYLGKRYALPLASPPEILSTWARAIVRYKLHKDRISDERSDPVARDYRDAIKFLQEVAAGKFSLGLDDPIQGASAPGEVQFEPGSKVFGREFLP